MVFLNSLMESHDPVPGNAPGAYNGLRATPRVPAAKFCRLFWRWGLLWVDLIWNFRNCKSNQWIIAIHFINPLPFLHYNSSFVCNGNGRKLFSFYEQNASRKTNIRGKGIYYYKSKRNTSQQKLRPAHPLSRNSKHDMEHVFYFDTRLHGFRAPFVGHELHDRVR